MSDVVRDKARAVCELLADTTKLQEEREFARKTRDKFVGISSSGATTGGPTSSISSQSMSAAPASGKYGGYGSKDIEQMGGYNNPAYGGSSAYDPYVNKSSAPLPTTTTTTSTKKKDEASKQEKPKKKKKKADSSDEDSSDSS